MKCAYCETWTDEPKCSQCGAPNEEWGTRGTIQLIRLEPPPSEKSSLTKWWERVVLGACA